MLLPESSSAAHCTVQATSTTQYTVNGALRRQISGRD